MDVLTQLLNGSMLAATFRMATPLILGGTGGVFSERAGIMNLGIEGEMLVGACAAAVVGIATGNAWLGVLGALLSGGLMGLLHAFICIRFHANQTVVGTGVNILATGITPLVLQTLYDSGAASPATPTLEAWSVPFLRDIPFLGAVLGTHSPLTYLALLLVPVSSFVLFRTRFGLRVRAVGEHPRAADTMGVHVYRHQYISVALCGMLAGLGGAYLSLCQVSMFVKGMTNGRGFMAMAAMIFGKWNPWGVLLAALLFGCSDALQMVLQAGGSQIPTDFLLCAPYLLTVAALACFVGKAVSPRQVGKPYIKD